MKQGPIPLNPGTVVAPPLQHSDPGKEKEWPSDPNDLPLPTFDTGVFNMELHNTDRLPQKLVLSTHERTLLVKNPESILIKAHEEAPKPFAEGTYRGTQLALTKMYDLVEKRYSSFMDIANFEPTVPSALSLDERRKFYVFSDPKSDGYPPHLNLNNKSDSKVTGPDQGKLLSPADIFDKMRLAQLTALLPMLVPDTFIGRGLAAIGRGAARIEFGTMGRPDEGECIADIEKYQRKQRAKTSRNDIFDLPNIGDLVDWHTDHHLGQQQFTGSNPTTVELASDFWVKHFVDAATDAPHDQAMKRKIEGLPRKELFVQDYSYFREYAGVKQNELISCPVDGSNKVYHYNTASVCLFHLTPEGELLPLAIVIDWVGPEKSVTIYNKELSNSDQGKDWPWRYAKTCVQSADWVRHEVTVHLTRTHMIEEATIVAAQQTLATGHPVYQLLYPHWLKTLSLNAAARDTLVPYVVVPLVGMNSDESKSFIRNEFDNFDFQENYIPRDLERRGFAIADLGHRKLHNYAWARCIYSMWQKIRSFVQEMLSLDYETDADVANDTQIKDWYTVLQAPAGAPSFGANIRSFPTITTREQLIDAVTMCIHIASPQHTSVNYLQNFYQAFVINKPPALYTPPPTTREKLDAFKEKDLIEALPINKPHDWLLASHIPYLLSFKPGDRESLIIYAASKYHVYKEKHSPREHKVAAAAYSFYQALADSEDEFRGYGLDTDDAGEITYDVLSPSWNAVSILI